MFEIKEEKYNQKACIKVLGLGGGGGNTINHMISRSIQGVDFIAANTDAQDLDKSLADITISLGESGLGAGANPEKGKLAAQTAEDKIKDLLVGVDMIFITAGMGGGTGTGSAPIFAKIAKDLGIVTIAVVTAPFKFENRDDVAKQGIDELEEQVNCLIAIPNEALIEVLGAEFKIRDAFSYADEIICNAVSGIIDIIQKPGFISVDFEDIKTILSYQGKALMSRGKATGIDAAIEAIEQASRHPLLKSLSLKGAKGILVNITADESFNVGNMKKIGEYLMQKADRDAKIITGLDFDDSFDAETVAVTIVATGLEEDQGFGNKYPQYSFKQTSSANRKLDLAAFLKTESGIPAIMRRQVN